jgi:hypothetical protein
MLNKILTKKFNWWIDSDVEDIRVSTKNNYFINLKLKIDSDWAYKSFKEYHYSSSFPDLEVSPLYLGDIVGEDLMSEVKLEIYKCLIFVTGIKPKRVISSIELELHDNLDESKIDKKPLLKDLQTMDFSLEDAKEELESLIKWFKSLPKELTLYRIIVADNKEDVNIKKPGSHYSTDKKNLKSSHSFASGYGKNKFILTVKADKSLIDADLTLSNRILYPNENEITLKNKGEGVEILSIKKIKNSLNEQSGAKESVLNLLNNNGLHETMDTLGFNIVDLCKFLEGYFEFTLDNLEIIISELFNSGFLRKNVNEFELSIDGMNGVLHWTSKLTSVMATPFWNGDSKIPIDFDYYDGEPFEESTEIEFDYNTELNFKNIEQVIDWFNNVYCPLVYHKIKKIEKRLGNQ